jgi:hypothetical protein
MLKEQAGASQPGVKLNAGQHLAASATAGAVRGCQFTPVLFLMDVHDRCYHCIHDQSALGSQNKDVYFITLRFGCLQEHLGCFAFSSAVEHT